MTSPVRFFPFCLPSFPSLHVVASNPGWSTLGDLAVISAVVLAGCGAVYGVAALASGGRWGGRLPPLASLAASVWFWGYPGLVHQVGRKGSVATHLMVFPVCLAVTVGLCWWLLRRPPSSTGCRPFWR